MKPSNPEEWKARLCDEFQDTEEAINCVLRLRDNKQLEKDLKIAVDFERYELASKIRDEIQKRAAT